MIQDINSAFSTDKSVLNVRSSAQLLQGRSTADLSPAYAAPPSLVTYTNRHLGHQGTVYETSHSRRQSAIRSNHGKSDGGAVYRTEEPARSALQLNSLHCIY